MITGCVSSSRTAVTLTINARPVTPVSGGNKTECAQSPVQTLTATATVVSGSTVVWYDAATGGNTVANPILNTRNQNLLCRGSKYSFNLCWSESNCCFNNKCKSYRPVSGGNKTECEASPIQTLTATATAPAGSTVRWYNAATGGNVIANQL
jgi:surface antigen